MRWKEQEDGLKPVSRRSQGTEFDVEIFKKNQGKPTPDVVHGVCLNVVTPWGKAVRFLGGHTVETARTSLSCRRTTLQFSVYCSPKNLGVRTQSPCIPQVDANQEERNKKEYMCASALNFFVATTELIQPIITRSYMKSPSDPTFTTNSNWLRVPHLSDSF